MQKIVRTGEEIEMNHPQKINPVQRRFPVFIICCAVVFSPTGAIASDSIENTGNILQLLIPSIALGTTIHLDDRQGRRQFYKSFVTNLATTYALKNIVDKKRPNGKSQSFPSGHTSAAFQGAAFIHRRYGLKYAVPAYLGAAFVGYSRVESDNHFVEDVVAGAAIGALSSYVFTKPYNGFTLTPVVVNGVYGLSIAKIW